MTAQFFTLGPSSIICRAEKLRHAHASFMPNPNSNSSRHIQNIDSGFCIRFDLGVQVPIASSEVQLNTKLPAGLPQAAIDRFLNKRHESKEHASHNWPHAEPDIWLSRCMAILSCAELGVVAFALRQCDIRILLLLDMPEQADVHVVSSVYEQRKLPRAERAPLRGNKKSAPCGCFS